MAEEVLRSGAEFDAASLPKDVRVLRLHTVRKPDFARLDGLQHLPLDELELRWISAPDLTHVPLPANLKTLRIWHSPKLKSLDGIAQARELETLDYEDTAPFTTGAALHDLPKLQTLILGGGMNAKLKVDSLDFLDGLSLRSFTMSGVEGAHLNLDPVVRMTSLEKVEIHGPNVEREELAKVAAAFPAFYDAFRDLKDYNPSLGMRCKTCGGVQKMLFLRRKKFLWCPRCDEKGLAKVLAEFDQLVQKARQNQLAN